MKNLLILAAMAALSIQGQPAAKAAPETIPTITETAPTLPTAKFWRLAAQAQGARAAVNQTDVAKKADAAEADAQAEYARLAALCGPKFQLGVQQDTKAENAGDLICVKRPEPEARPEAKKDK